MRLKLCVSVSPVVDDSRLEFTNMLHVVAAAAARHAGRVNFGPTVGRSTGVNPAGDAGDTSPQYFGWGDVNGNIPPILLRTFGYSRPIMVALRSLSLKPFSFGYKTPPIRFSQAGGQSAHKARPPPNLELALTPLLRTVTDVCPAGDRTFYLQSAAF